ncbi:MAG: D-2-hydroxyacid dehydrogenase [Phycisphaera sp.]|nr:D-2-hydroxyacid dehydrogenase [Phycisphaera sp.]
MKIVCLDGYTLNPGDNPWDAVAALGDFTVYDRTPDDQIVARAAGADIILTNKTQLTEKTLAQLPGLKFIAVLATGYNVVDIAAARKRGIPVSNVPVYGTETVAQHIFAVLLSHIHQPVGHDRAIREGQWAQSGDFSFWNSTIFELSGKVFGVVGFGRIGRRVAELAHAFGMEVWAYDVNRANPPAYSPFAWKTIEEVFAGADVVSLHCPQTADNAGMVNKALLSTMKPTAMFLNAARGGLVNEADLAQALNEGKLAFAGLDVLSVEPISENNPLLKAKNCLLTPHIAWAAVEARRRLMATVADNIRAFIAGKPINVVNKNA